MVNGKRHEKQAAICQGKPADANRIDIKRKHYTIFILAKQENGAMLVQMRLFHLETSV
ncbi:MAG: hypothetical protein IJ719_14630 [Clostridia bacterium]|nr:hypothetical protein [Clostridia bacterium]